MSEGNSIYQNGVTSGRVEFSFWIDRGIRNNIETAIQELSRLHVTAALAASARLGHIRITGLNNPAMPFSRKMEITASWRSSRPGLAKEPRFFLRS